MMYDTILAVFIGYYCSNQHIGDSSSFKQHCLQVIQDMSLSLNISRIAFLISIWFYWLTIRQHFVMAIHVKLND